jgi:hypothetical protein
MEIKTKPILDFWEIKCPGYSIQGLSYSPVKIYMRMPKMRVTRTFLL